MDRFSIGQRLSLAFGLVLVLTAMITLLGLWRLQRTSVDTAEMMKEPLTKERLIGDWYRNIQTGVRRTTAIVKSSDSTLADFFAEESKASSKASGDYKKQIEGLLRTPGEQALFAKISHQRKIYLKSRDEISQLKKAGDMEGAAKIFADVFTPATAAFLSHVEELLNQQRASIDAAAAQIDETNTDSRNLILALGLLALGIGASFSFFITRSITRPIGVALAATQRVAAGDLGVLVESHAQDETGVLLRSLNEMQGRLKHILHSVRENADGVSSASSEIASGISDLSSRTEQQAAALQETAATMDQLGATVRNNAQNARLANELAAGASRTASQGGEVVSEVVQTMRDINSSSKKISDIISVIDGIAFQTNILALNAAVEAARAGEQGRGFAVVASEVRSLAQRSATAAREIKALIHGSVDQVERGTVLVDQAGGRMTEIVEAIKRVSDIVAQISLASEEQSDGVNQIGKTVTQLDQATQQNATLAEQGAASAEVLKDRAGLLKESVSVFKLAA
ncbi:methyl-accepting chemotaxis protein [Piscinibacter sp. HJYY11]|uniref:methyl-accepting chemotaxis protein n=1 Tax=Piscinibacter sp. HJYY11 TaxID=2801333 RepID=UPI00191E0D09|nr:methyl-accepting chemotaxis protein [Piscinibacter sp. HJYY11]MBL0727294.1 MCP four helix bundle domain-containing protein [Piscinibacter sp. HJYY11]